MAAATAAFMAGSALLSAGLNASAQRDAIRQAKRYNRQMRQNSIQQMNSEIKSRNFKTRQQLDQITQQENELMRETLQKQGEARAAAGSSGLSGSGIERLSSRFQEQAERALQTIASNEADLIASTEMSNQSTRRTTQSRIEANWKRPEFSESAVASAAIKGASQGASLKSNLSIMATEGK